VNHVIQNSNNNNTYYTHPFCTAAANNDHTTTRHRLCAAHALYNIYFIAICEVDRSTMVMFAWSSCGCKWRRVYKEWLETFTVALCVGIYNLALIIIYNMNIYANSLCSVDIVVIFYRMIEVSSSFPRVYMV